MDLTPAHQTGNFDLIAPVYDFLAQLVFGDRLKKAQLAFIHELPINSQILILGGGSGWILKELAHLNRPMTVTYVDSSSVMIKKSKERELPDQFKQNINFIEGTQEDIPQGQIFTHIFTFFFLDLFDKKSLRKLVREVSASLETKGEWWVVDFSTENNNRRNLGLVRLMYLFFSVVSGIKNKSLPPIKEVFEEQGFTLSKLKKTSNGLIHSMIFSYSDHP